ncbi:MAG: DNA-processing protein DprA [Acidiferrobacterales bacterium]
MNPDTLRCWLALHRVPGLGVQAVETLVDGLGSVDAIFSAPRSRLQPLLGGATPTVEAILAGPDPKLLEQDLAWVQSADHHLLTFHDPQYPQLLREIAQPPLLLFVVGDRALLQTPQLAIVGSRNPTPAGLENTTAFAGALAQAGLTITSGLALGIDSAAHRGALDAGGRTVAVLGTGVEQVYPARNAALARRIREQGVLVSEFPLGTPPKSVNFPRRNRIISGLSLGTLVVEAAAESGSLITARFAGEQGREVFAVPGSIHSPLARGCHALIRQGAKLVETAQDVLEELGALAMLVQNLIAVGPANSDASVEDPRTRALLDYIGYDPVSIDTLIERSGLTADCISSMLLKMELSGIVKACPGGKYMRLR